MPGCGGLADDRGGTADESRAGNGLKELVRRQPTWRVCTAAAEPGSRLLNTGTWKDCPELKSDVEESASSISTRGPLTGEFAHGYLAWTSSSAQAETG